MRSSIFILFIWLAAAVLAAPAAQAMPLNTWKVSCGADPGSISRKGKVWVFRTSSNHCPGGFWQQRAELSTQSVPPTIRGAYLFRSVVAMTSSSTQKFDIFQIHDGRMGCAPPLKVEVQSSGRLKLVSDIKTGPGESCIRGVLNDAASRGRLPRDGSEHELRVLLQFDGTGAFDVTVWLDGKAEISGRYVQPTLPGAYRAQKFYFKHGVYSQYGFPYVMTSRDMSVRKVRVAQ